MPPECQNVIVTLADGSERYAYWNLGQWWVGVANDPNDAPLADVVSWREG